MAAETIEKDYISIRVYKKIGKANIRRLTEYARYLESNPVKPKKVSQKDINELAKEINKSAWEKLKQKRGFKW